MESIPHFGLNKKTKKYYTTVGKHIRRCILISGPLWVEGNQGVELSDENSSLTPLLVPIYDKIKGPFEKLLDSDCPSVPISQ